MNNKKLMEKLLLFYRPFLGNFAISWCFVAIITALTLAMPYSIGKIIDSANAGKFEEAYWWAGIGIISMLLGRSIVQYNQYIYEIKKLDYAVENRFRKLGLLKMNELSVGQHQNQNSGVKQDVVTSGCSSLLQLNDLFLNNISFMVLHAVIGLSVLIANDLVIASITATSIIVYLTISAYFNYKNSEDLDEVIKKDNSSQKRYTDYIRNICLLLLNSNEKEGLKNYDEARGEYENSGKKFWIRYVKFFNTGNAIVTANTGSVLFYCIYLYSKGAISLGEISIYIFWTNITTGFLANFNSVFRSLIRQVIKVKKLFAFLDIEAEIKSPVDEIEMQNFSGQVEFKDVTFSYPDWKYFKDFEDEDDPEEGEVTSKEEEIDKDVLSNISFSVNAREKVAFVGHSGAGKSTIISLLLRAYVPQSGKIFLDGVDMDRLDPKKFRKMIGLVEQDIQLMDDTIRQNLLIGMNGHSADVGDAELWEAMEIANLSNLKKRLRKGLDTNIGERGIKLSGGEKQRLAIARALLKKAPLIIFDEATSSLDSVNEHEIHEAMARASKNTTCIFIAHRLATVKDADRIFVMAEGRIIAEGKHGKLLETCETYRKLVERQVVAF